MNNIVKFKLTIYVVSTLIINFLISWVLIEGINDSELEQSNTVLFMLFITVYLLIYGVWMLIDIFKENK